jgi:hypothetical protein
MYPWSWAAFAGVGRASTAKIATPRPNNMEYLAILSAPLMLSPAVWSSVLKMIK